MFMTVHAKATNKVSVQEAQQIAEDAYIYGYPLITMEMTRRVMTNVREPEGTRGPMGHLLRIRSYPTAAFKDVTAPTGKFILMLRLYWPKETPPSIIDGSWKIPGVPKLK